MSGNWEGKRENMFFRRLARRSRREETRSMSDFRLPAAPKVRTIKVAGIVRRRCDLGPGSGPIWGRGFNTAEVEKVHAPKRAQLLCALFGSSLRRSAPRSAQPISSLYRMGLK